jgi:hypothetical protein
MVSAGIVLTAFSTFPTHDLFDVPSQNSSNITFSNVGQNSMTVNWTNGNGDGRVLIMRAGDAPNKFPLDGTDYSAGNAFSPEQDLGWWQYHRLQRHGQQRNNQQSDR